MKNIDIKALSIKELDEKIMSEEFNLINLKLNHSLTPIENPLKIKFTRRMIARFKTQKNVKLQKEQ